MAALLLTPPIAFIIYVLLTGLLLRVSHRFAASSPATAMKSTTYGSGETAPTHPASAGYRTFFVIALFFAVLHLGTLVLGTSNLLPISAVYIAGLGLILLVLILG
jgi:NADH:ubiquinone oxidoreductase subunit 3 (subunit A)